MNSIYVVNESAKAQRQASPTTELRCAATPETVAKLVAMGAQVWVETGCGAGADFSDSLYAEAGATVVALESEQLGQADIVLFVTKPEPTQVSQFKPGCLIIGHLDPFFEQALIAQLQQQQVSVLSMEMIPRSTRSQKMDALSSQSNLAGYVMVMQAASHLNSILPMMMTPSGTIKPAKVFVIGAGVAGLQAIATAKRLGASVLAFDTRSVVAEQVESLGAKFLNIDLGETGQNKDGYANALSAEQIARQQQGQAKAIADSDIVITTAKLFGRKPPQLISKEVLGQMRTGSVVVDMAAEDGGNVEGSIAGRVVDIAGVKVVGTGNWSNEVAKDASNMYGNNVFNLLQEFWHTETKQLELDLQDDIMDGCLIVHRGQLRNDMLQQHYQTSEEQ